MEGATFSPRAAHEAFADVLREASPVVSSRGSTPLRALDAAPADRPIGSRTPPRLASGGSRGGSRGPPLPRPPKLPDLRSPGSKENVTAPASEALQDGPADSADSARRCERVFSSAAVLGQTRGRWRPNSRPSSMDSGGYKRKGGWQSMPLRRHASEDRLCTDAPKEKLRTASPSPLPPRPISRYEDICRKEGILPKFARPARDARLIEEEFDLSNLGLGDAQFSALLQDTALVPAAKIKLWRLRDIRISAGGAEALANTVEPTTEILDIKTNEIGRKGVEAISRPMLEDRLPQLRWLDLSRNSLRSDAVAGLAAALLHCPILLRLELNHNVIQDGIGLGSLVRQHKSLTRLSLHCNYLSGRGIAALFEGVLQNSRSGFRLADIDVAWNGAGDSDALSGAKAIAAVLEESVVLYHLDLSYNSFGADCCAAIGTGLKDNHYLYGLHMVGNATMVDADGFLSPLQVGPLASKASGFLGTGSPSSRSPGALARFGDPTNSVSSSIALSSSWRSCSKDSLCSQNSSVRAVGMVWSDDALLRERDVLEQRTTCWACEGWQRVELEWPLADDEPPPKAVWAFTSLDGFKAGLRLQKVPGVSKFAAARMVPPINEPLLVVFQVDASLRTPPGMPSVDLDKQGLKPIDIELRACEELPELNPPNDQEVLVHTQKTSSKGIVEHILVVRSNTAGVIGKDAMALPASARGPAGQRSVLLDPTDGSGVPVQMPRVTEREFKFKTRRARGKSFWSGFKEDSDKVVSECLQMDWSRAKVIRLIKNPEEREGVNRLVRQHYKQILALYRQLSAVDIGGDTPFGVGQIQTGEMFSAIGCMDADTRVADIDRFFIASKVMPIEMKKTDLTVRNDKALTRHQFLEIILRVAQQRHVEKGNATDMVDAVGRVLADLTQVFSDRMSGMEQFLAALHTEDCDNVYKKHQAQLQAVFQRCSGGLTPPGQPNFMALVEFQSLLEGLSAFDEKFQSRNSSYAFRMGMMTQADECLSSRFQEMTFLEFQHALGAVIFLRSDFTPAAMPILLDRFFSSNLIHLLPADAQRRSLAKASPSPSPPPAARTPAGASPSPSPPPAARRTPERARAKSAAQ